MNSPFYKGTLLWDKLSIELKSVNNGERFVEELKMLYVVYHEIWLTQTV